jgi:protein gp37
MCDIFDNHADPEDSADFWHLVRETPSLDWLILTKRPQNAPKMLPARIPPNVWLGVTAENQTEADRRVPLLRALPARIRFICAEPLLERVRLNLDGIAWVIVGGESGPGARDMHPDWARDVRDQCRAAGVPLFMKQMSRRAPIPPDLLICEFPL